MRLFGRECCGACKARVGTSNWLESPRVVACAKHYIGDGATQGGEDQGDAQCTEEELANYYIKPYMAALDAGVQTVMASYNSWHGDKMHGHQYLMTTILKERLGFDGVIVGDWNGHGQVPGGSSTTGTSVINAGLDMFMAPDGWRELRTNLIDDIEKGRVPISRLDDARCAVCCA